MRSYGAATVVSVDGPGRLTLKGDRGAFKVRLWGIDTPQPGECGAAESMAALGRLVERRGPRVSYVFYGRSKDAEGRFAAMVGPRSADLLERSLARDLVRTEWARAHVPITVSEFEEITMGVASDEWGPRSSRGLWSRCGGSVHLPASAQVPQHAPSNWAITADGVTEAVGPMALSATLAPGSTLTVADVAQLARVETAELSEDACLVRVPSMELMLWASRATTAAACATSGVFAVATTGPGAATATRGARVGMSIADMRPLFPRLASLSSRDLEGEGSAQLVGATRVPWAWQTRAALNPKTGAVLGFLTSASNWEG